MLSTREPPNSFRTLTASDSTDITTIATRGLFVTATGTVFVMGTGDTAMVSLGAQSAGTFIPGSFKRFGASSTAQAAGCSGP